MGEPANAAWRILIVDDAPAIHQDFRRILTSAESSASLDDMEASLFGTRSSRPKGFRFEVDSAYQGEEGLQRVRAARAEGRPYALAFVDIRMPPGMDGVETTERLWKEEPDLQVVLCSAHTDYSWEQVTQRLGISQRLLILRKPFDSIEVRQLAHALVEKWQLLRRDRQRMEELASAVKERTQELERANQQLRREAEERLLLETQLAEARRLDALGQLAAGLAHEVNNPLSFVISNVHYIGQELAAQQSHPSGQDASELREACNDALLGCERIRRLVQDVRLFARMGGAAVHSLVDVRAAVEESLAIASSVLPVGTQLALELHPVPPVMADPHGLGQVFLNLLVNAAHAMTGTGLPPRLRLMTRLQPDGRVLVEVQDNGQGILPEHLGRIFEPFFTTKPVGVGTGLGLSICHGIIAGIGGELSAESQPGQGATFRVLLSPASRAPAPLP